MKLMTVIATLLMTASTAFGHSLLCENGDINVVGDAYQAYEISKNQISYRGWEWGYEVQAKDIVFKGNTASIQNVANEYFAEGDVYQQVLNEMMVLSADKKTLQVTTSLDGGPFESKTLSCKTIK